ncbi:MAG: ATP-binding protein [Oscillospiraceae bacterium]|nr:ATP-binding protein [Oscillospiraceae bacterium]
MAKAILICGRICTGKSTYADSLCAGGKAVSLSIDGLMLAMLDPYLGDMHEVYTARAEKYLLEKSVEIINAGCDVVLDWGFWTAAQRREIKEFYRSKDIQWEMHYLDIDDREWRRRLEKRNRLVQQGKTDAYYVDENLAAKFRSKFEKPDRNEADVWVTQ